MSSRNRKIPFTQSELNEMFKYSNGTLYHKTNRGPNKTAGNVAGNKRRDGRHRVSIKNVKYFRYRIIWKMFYNSEPEYIDHIDGNCSNDDIMNLQKITVSLNILKGKTPKLF